MSDLLNASIAALKKLHEETHDGMDSSKQEELSNIIEQLEMFEKQKTNVNHTQILNLFGSAIKLVPAIEQLIKLFMD